MDNQITSASYSVFTNKGAYALLIGSGISRNSGIPTGWDITLQLINQIAILEKQISIPDLEQWYRDRFGKQADYSDILERLTNTQEERLNLLRPFLEPDDEELEEGLKSPTVAHQQIAQLVRKGYIKVILTTNFDRLLENAFKEVGIEPTIISNPEHIENSIPLIHSKVTIIKINGDYLDTTLLNIKSELEDYDLRLKDGLKFIFENFGLITCGWSAKWDIGLVNSLKSANKFRYGSYFCYINKPDDELVTLSNYRNGGLISINDADSFFTELKENVESLEKNNAKHPLTAQLVLQRLKKYIVKPEYFIDLNDFCQSVVVDFENRNKHIQYEGTIVNVDSIKKVRDAYLYEMDILNIVAANLSFYGKDIHSTTLFNIIRQVSVITEKTNVPRNSSLIDIVYLPTLVLRYICGISCVATKNYSLIDQIHKLTFKGKSGDETIMNCTEPNKIINPDYLKEMDGNTYYLPMNELMFKCLRKYFSGLIPLDEDYEKFFNYYEFIYSLTYTRKDSYMLNWFPQGRFGYYENRNIIESEIVRMKKEASQHEFIKTDLFSNLQDFAKALLGLQTFYARIHY